MNLYVFVCVHVHMCMYRERREISNDNNESKSEPLKQEILIHHKVQLPHFTDMEVECKED